MRVVPLLVGLMLTIPGCQTLHDAGVPGLESYLKPDPVKIEQARNQRERFMVDRDHAAFYWLLSHKICTGMNLQEVEDELGGPGEFTEEFSMLKSDGLYQTTDSAYRWGPDNKGFSAIVFFRDGRVVNFEPKDYVTP